MAMQVTAIKPGFYDGARRRAGDVFDIPDGKPLPGWVAAGKKAAPAAVAPLNGDTKPANAAKASRKKRADTDELA